MIGVLPMQKMRQGPKMKYGGGEGEGRKEGNACRQTPGF